MPRKKTSSSPAPSTGRNSAEPGKSPESKNDRRASTYVRGVRGEERATEHLRNQGYRILERNFRTRGGEVDIIAIEGGTIAFCEVKSWERMPLEGLEHALSRRKQGRIIRTSLCYLQVHPDLTRLQPRFDVLFVCPERVEHLKNAFSGCGAW